MIHEQLYLSPRFKSREELEAAIEANWDATTSSQVARCPRNGEYSIRYGLRPNSEALYLKAGNALHGALACYYVGESLEVCLEELATLWGSERDYVPPGEKFAHLTLGFLEVILKNYAEYAKKRDNFRPIVVKLNELDLSRVLGAVWRVNDEGEVVLGESKIIMDFSDWCPGPFIYSGKPDLPIEMGGALYLMDHKSTSGYLSNWYFDQYRFSNQLRGYCAMINELTHMRLNGALINGLYTGERAVLAEFKGDRFGRYGPMIYHPEHLREAILNQYHWRQVLDYWEKQGYYPQHTSRLCTNCAYDMLCALSPSIREGAMKTEYTVVDRAFLDL
jgi:hypothetical protein